MQIIPAILEEKSQEAFTQLDALRGHVPWIQIDVMDGTMTPGKTCDLLDFVGSVDDFSVEVHLMTENPIDYLEACDTLGAERVYFHLSAVESPSAVLAAMDPYVFTKGICLSPQTAAEDVFTYIDEIDAVQIMTVVPGEQGGQFMPEMLDKIPYLRERRTEMWLSVDGGVNMQTIEAVAAKQLDAAGVGSGISRADDPVDAYERLVKKVDGMEYI